MSVPEDHAQKTALTEPESESKTEEVVTTKAEEAAPSVTNTSDDEILRQVEFYFSDSNLPVDKFLWQLTTKNEGGWIEVSTICSFKRMRALLRPDEALEPSPEKSSRSNQRKTPTLKPSDQEIERVSNLIKVDSKLLEIDESGQKLRRKEAFDAARTETATVNEMSVYVKGFTGPEAAESPKLQVNLEKFFNQFGKTKAVRLRRTDPAYKAVKGNRNLGAFKGSCFVQFEDVKTAHAFLALDPPPKWQGKDLLIMGKEKYMLKKAEEKGIPMTVIEARNGPSFDVTKGKMDDSPKRGEKRKFKEDDKEIDFIPKCVFRFSDAGTESNYKIIKQVMAPIAQVQYVDFSSGDRSSGTILFRTPLTDELVKVLVDPDSAADQGSAELVESSKKITFNPGDGRPKFTLLSGDDEKQFHLARRAALRNLKTRDEGRPADKRSRSLPQRSQGRQLQRGPPRNRGRERADGRDRGLKGVPSVLSSEKGNEKPTE